MPGKVKVKIISGRNLPVMDRSGDTTDAYVEIKLGGTTFKTDVCRKSLNPNWNSEWYRFEVDDTELQDEPLQIRLMDHDTYSANDAIGKVYLDLNPLLLPVAAWNGDRSGDSNSIMSGWIPVYDTMHGIRGEVNVIVKVELFSDFNRFRQSSCGIQFFCSKSVPQGYFAQTVHGFVEELIINDDPEYQWIDKIRTPRASNEARQTLFFKLSGELQRKIGVKALDMGGNAVMGYCQCFDLEGDSGIVARGIGTAVTLIKILDLPPSNNIVEMMNETSGGSPEVPEQSNNHHRTESVGTKIVHSPAKLNNTMTTGIHRRSSDSDLSITPKGNSLTGSDRSGCGPIGHPPKINISRMTVPQDNFDMLEYPFLTMSKYPPGFITQIGGSVSARSVKLLERVPNIDEPEIRNIWWSEIRLEIRSHARALNCNAVLAYLETTSICEDVCVLSASGTAAVIGCPYPGEVGDSLGATSKSLKETTLLHDADKTQKDKCKTTNDSPDHNGFHGSPCIICHLPYNTNNVPVRSTVSKCTVCRIGKVPEMLIATIEVPDGVPTIGHACFIQSFVCRQLKDCRSESNAKEISDGLPFLEYELHRILINKLKIKGMNAIFGLKTRISIGEKMLLGMATGTAVFLEPLKPPVLPKLVSTRTSDEKKLNDLQKMIMEYVKKSKEIYQLKGVEENQNGRVMSDDESEEEQTSIDMSLGNKDCCVLEVDDPEDAEVVNLLLEERPPNGFHVVNTEFVPKLEEVEIVKNLQMFTQIYRTKIQIPYNFNTYFQRLLQSVYFKLRRMVPCALCDLQFRVEIPESDEIQLCVLGMALGLGEVQKHKFKRKNTLTKRNDDDLIFNLEEDQIPENSIPTTPTQASFLNAHQSSRHRQKSPLRNRIQTIKQRHIPYRERHGVDITPLSYIPGGKIEHYLGNLNFFFIRETTSLREEGGLSGFIHSFVTEVLAIVRAHVTALGGNAMVAYFMTECVLNHNLHKNQGQCLINVGGDVVFVSYFKEDP